MTTTENAVKTFRSIRKNAYRDRYEWMMTWKQLMDEHPTDNADIAMKRKNGLDDMKREIRKMNRDYTDRYAVPACTVDAPRGVTPYEDEPDHITYWYEEDNGETDEEIDEYVESMRIECRCTDYNPDGAGMPFTYRLSWKRTPYGIRIIHGRSLNI